MPIKFRHIIAALLLLGFNSARAQDDTPTEPIYDAFSATVSATLIKDENDETLDALTYESGIDALKAGNFAAFLTRERAHEDINDADSHLSYLALGLDAYLRGDAEHKAFFDKIPEGSRDRHFADKFLAWIILLDGEQSQALSALSDANGDRISPTEELALAAMLEGMGRLDQAEAVYSTLLPTDLRKPKNDFDIQNIVIEQYRTTIARLASLYRQKGKIDEAAAVYEVLIKADPENAARYKGYIADVRSDSPTEAEPLTPETAFSLAIHDMAARDYRNRILAANQRGTRLKDFDMRYAIFLHTALMVDPDEDNRWLAIANQLIDKRQFEGAAHILNASGKDSSWVKLTLAETQLKLLNPKAARNALKVAVKSIEEDEKRAVLGSAMNLYASLGDVKQTRRLGYRLLSLIDTAPNKPASYSALAYAYRDIGQYGRAVEYMRKAVALDDSHPRRMSLWTMLGEAGQVDEAERGLRNEYLTRLDDPYMLNGLGYFLIVHTDKLEEGYKLLMRADALAPDNPFITDSVGWALYKLGHFERAKTLIERSRKVYLPNLHWEVEDHLGDIYWHIGEKEEAKKFWTASLEQYPPQKDKKRIEKKLKNGLSEDKPVKKDLPRVNLDEPVDEEKDI